MKSTVLVGMLLATSCIGASPPAQAQAAYAAKDVNLRAGPARDYPVVAIVPAGVGLDVQGCLSDYAWCDVIAGPYRGWVYAGNIDYAYDGQYVPLASYGPELGIAIVGFVLLDYWARFYVSEPFYRDRDRWEHHAPPRPRDRPPRRVAPALPAAPTPLQPLPPSTPLQPPAPALVPRGRLPPLAPPLRPAPIREPAPQRQPSPQHPAAPLRPAQPWHPAPPSRPPAPMRTPAPGHAPARDGARAPQTPGRDAGAHGQHRTAPDERGAPGR